MLEQPREQVELLGRQLDGLAGDLDLTRVAAQLDVAELERLLLRAVLGAPQHGLDPGGELAWREGLRDVVVGAHLEPGDAIGLLVAGGEHHDRDARAGADPAADVEAVHPGQADVEHDHPHRVAGQLDERLLAGSHPDQAVAGSLEVATHQRADRALVLDEEDRRAERRRGRAGLGLDGRRGAHQRLNAWTVSAGALPLRTVWARIPFRSAASETARPPSVIRAPGETGTVTSSPVRS